MKDVIAQVQGVELINQNVYQVNLEIADTQFIAGQYLMIVLPTGEQVPYSIGSAPNELPNLTLYILVSDPESLAHKVVEHIQNNSSITVKMPGGDCHLENGMLNSPAEHILLIAGGTGFSQIKSLHDTLVANQFAGKISVYWGLRTVADVFAKPWLEAIAEQPNVSLNVIVNDPSPEWQGRTGWLYESVLADHDDLSQYKAVISGSVGMVYGTLDQLELKGLSKDNCYSDVFAYAPHPDKPQL